MGWASYLEDICFRHQDDRHHSDAMIGPAGSRGSRTTPELSARFMRLEHLLKKAGSDLTDFYQREHLDRLSNEMDEVLETLERFQTLTILASNADVMETTEDLEKRAGRVIDRAKSTIQVLSLILHPLFAQASSIDQMMQQKCIKEVPTEHVDLAQDVNRLQQGIHLAATQYEQLVTASEEFQITLAGELMSRIVDSGRMDCPDRTIRDRLA
jgi:hypothetical protein